MLVLQFNLKCIIAMLFGNCSLSRFVVDPCNYGKTIENMFHVSFLIKEQKAKIMVENGTPLIRPFKAFPVENLAWIWATFCRTALIFNCKCYGVYFFQYFITLLYPPQCKFQKKTTLIFCISQYYAFILCKNPPFYNRTAMI